MLLWSLQGCTMKQYQRKMKKQTNNKSYIGRSISSFIMTPPRLKFFYYAYGVLNGLICVFHLLIKKIHWWILPLCLSYTCLAGFEMCWFTGNWKWENVGSDCVCVWEWVCVCVCVPVCRQPLCFSLSFIFLHWGESASSESPSSFLTYTSPSALVPIIEMIVN